MFERIDAARSLEEIKAINDEMTVRFTEVFWDARLKVLGEGDELEKQKARAKCRYINWMFASSIPVTKDVGRFISPHGFKGISISAHAKLGADCVIFQNVTIGSNTLPDSKNAGFPVIGDKVYIGAGANIIGNVKVGNNVRIGAGCSIATDIPDNATVVSNKPIVLKKEKAPDNKWYGANEFEKMFCPPPIASKVSDVRHMFKRAEGRVLDARAKKKLDEAFTILFCGDLILLEDQVKNAYTGSGYDFSPMFEYTRRYIEAADFSIGVFEGPLGGNARDYSQSNYDDGIHCYLNFPDEFVDAVKDAGFDRVTTATNHLLDMGYDGLNRTLETLNRKQLDHIGTYLDAEDKQANHVKIVEREGIRMAFLAYVSAVNAHVKEYFIGGKREYVTSVLVNEDSPKYNAALERVRKDFELAKSYEPDLIIVMPHWGIQFTDNPSTLQELWRKNFLELGADIIFGDHTHSVQPVKLERVDGRMTYTLYCAGNYANIYREHNGDATAMVEVYVDRAKKEVIGGAVIPMWTQSALKGNYRALPIYDIINDPKLGREISTRDMERVRFIHKHITRVMLGTELDHNLVQEKYYHDVDGFVRSEAAPLELTEEMRSGTFYRLLTSVKNVCFVGDSVTEGTKNNGVPWYEPLEHLIEGNVFNRAWGSRTSKRLVKEHLAEILDADAELFVIAIGANDVRYRNPAIRAVNAEEYVEWLTVLRDAILDRHPAAKFCFIAPWTSTDGDRVTDLKYAEKIELNAEYSAALKQMCGELGDAFIDPTDYIQSKLKLHSRSKYLLDWIHPNATEGVKLYSEAVLLSR